MTRPSSMTLVVPVVEPVWMSKEFTYSVSEGLSYKYYDLITSSAEIEGKLTVSGFDVSVEVIKGEPGAHYADHLSRLPENYCGELNLWSVLEHDEYYFASGTNWAIYSGKEVPSVTIPVDPGDHIFATSFGKAVENGHATSNGIRGMFLSPPSTLLILN